MPDKSASELLPDVLQIVESDLMKAHHYLDKAMQVAMHSGNIKAAYDIAPIAVGVSMYIKQTTHTIKKLKEVATNGR